MLALTQSHFQNLWPKALSLCHSIGLIRRLHTMQVTKTKTWQKALQAREN
jgi:hypothetical protein